MREPKDREWKKIDKLLRILLKKIEKVPPEKLK